MTRPSARSGTRIAAFVGAVLLGGLLGLAGAFVQAHRSVITVGDRYVVIPWGALLAGLLVVLIVRLVVVGSDRRSLGWLVLGGWLVATLAFATVSPSGDIALSGGTRQMIYLLGVVIVGSAMASIPGTLRRARSSDV